MTKTFKRRVLAPEVHMLKDRKNDLLTTKCGKELSYKKDVGKVTIWNDDMSCVQCIRGDGK